MDNDAFRLNRAGAVTLYAIDGMVFELLGFNFTWSVWKTFPSVVDQIDQMDDLFERAIAKWGDLPKVVSAFAYFATIVPSSRLPVIRNT